MNRAFKLEPILRIREMQEKQAAGVHAAALNGVRVAQDRAASLEVMLGETVLPSGVSAEQLRAAARLVEVNMNTLAETHVDIQQLSENAEVTRVAWTEAAQRSKVLEKLRSRHVTAVNVADQHAEIIQVDDLVSARYATRKN